MALFHSSFACFFPRNNATIFRKYLGGLKKLAPPGSGESEIAVTWTGWMILGISHDFKHDF